VVFLENYSSSTIYRHIIDTLLAEKDGEIGFEAPQQLWFKELKTFIKENLPVRNDEFVLWENIHYQFDLYFENQISEGKLDIWRLFNFAIWRRLWEL